MVGSNKSELRQSVWRQSHVFN